jgi:hypothetical protein
VGRSGRVHRLAGLGFAGFESALFGQVALVHRADVALEVVDAEEAHPAAWEGVMSARELWEVRRGEAGGTVTGIRMARTM